jgi:hypothetical protein
MRWQLRDPRSGARRWPDYTFGCKRVLFSSLYLPALQRPNAELSPRRSSGMTRDGPVTEDGRVARGRLRHLRHGLPHQRLHVPDGDHRAAAGRSARSGRRRARAPGHHRARLPLDVRALRTEHQHLRRLDHLLPRAQVGYLRQALQRVAATGAAAIDVRPEVERPATVHCRHGSPAPPGPGATPGTATAPAGSSPTGPAT